jgi:hypothetical protein
MGTSGQVLVFLKNDDHDRSNWLGQHEFVEKELTILLVLQPMFEYMWRAPNSLRDQLLEGLEEESQIEDIGKREGIGARSLTRNTRGVEGGVLELRN